MESALPYVVEPDLASPDVDAEQVPGGPLLVRGAACVRDESGTAHLAERPIVALCTCGYSQRKPWCDATHKVARGS